MGLSRTVSEIDCDFSRKSQKNFPPLVFAPPLKGFPLELSIDAGDQKLEWWGYRAAKEVLRYLQPSEYNTPTWRTDRRTDAGRQQRPCLRIASRGKNRNFCEVLVKSGHPLHFHHMNTLWYPQNSSKKLLAITVNPMMLTSNACAAGF